MTASTSHRSVNRRQFLSKGVAGCTSLCLGCSYLGYLARAQGAQKDKSFEATISENSGMSLEHVYNFAFRDTLAPVLIALSRQVGREKLVEMLKGATDEVWFHNDNRKRFEADLPKGFWARVLKMEVLEDTPTLHVYKISKCLWAKAFREADAADLGYALWCYGDYAMARADKEHLERNSTLMQGHDCCLLKYTKQT